MQSNTVKVEFMAKLLHWKNNDKVASECIWRVMWADVYSIK